MLTWWLQMPRPDYEHPMTIGDSPPKKKTRKRV
jgi:hypothetical protein